MHMDLDEYRSPMALKRFTLKYVKVLQNLERKPGGVHLVGDDGGSAGDSSDGGDGGDFGVDEDIDARVAKIMNLEQFDPSDQAEICAFMKTRFRFRPGAAGGPAGRFTGAAQGG